MGSKGWREAINHECDAEGLVHPGRCRMRASAPRAARYYVAAPCPWGHTERLYGSVQSESW